MRSALVRARALVIAFAMLGAAPMPIVQPTLSGATWTPDGIAKLDADLDAMLANDPALKGAHYGVYAIDTATGAPLYSRNVDDEIQPASTLKLLVGSAALEKLGGSYRFQTRVQAADSSSSAPIVLVAGGDPFLSISDLRDAAAAVANARRFAGDVLVDATRFDEKPYPDGWTWDDFAYSYAPKISAAGLEENVVHVRVSPGASVGAPATLEVTPRAWSDDANATDCASTVHVDVRSRVVTSLASANADDIDVVRSPGGCIDVVGTIPLGSAAQEIDATVPSPVEYARDFLLERLMDLGVHPSFRIVESDGPDEHRFESEKRAPLSGPVYYRRNSAPLSTWLGPRFWIPSDNLVGEMLLRELGFVTAGAPGTTDNGIAYEKQWLQSIGVDPKTVTLADGCGMSQYDRITPRDLVTILQHDWNGPNRQLVLDSLPVGGARGTIEGIAGSDAAGRVFAKTGSMMHVRGLAGYLATLHHGPVTFAFQVDDWNGEYPALAALRARVLSRIIDD